jgi:hypothetical protein
MEINVRRFEYGTNFTIGRMSVDGVYECFVLEDKVRLGGIKIAGGTAIPANRYVVVVNHSVHFDKTLPQILDVPGFEGIRIHPGNTDADTEGCLLVGNNWSGGDCIQQSRAAFDILFPKIQKAFDAKEPIYITIEDTK